MESISRRFFGLPSYQRFDKPGSANSRASCANPYNEPEPLAACRVGDLDRLDRELQKDRSIVYQGYRSVKSGDIVSLLVIERTQTPLQRETLRRYWRQSIPPPVPFWE